MKVIKMSMMWCQSSFFLLLMLVFSPSESNGYKPVVIMHGLFDKPSDLSQLVTFIEKAHPGTVLHNIDLYDDYDSLTAMWTQLEKVSNVTQEIMRSSNDGVHLIGYSQGGLLSRALIQTINGHNIHNFVALSSPLNGQYGDTSYINKYFPIAMKKDLYKYFYTKDGQRWSIADYWKDPHQVEYYKEYSSFLAPLNNESCQESFHYPSTWRKNFVRLNKLVLIGGPDDGVITPWQSAQFGCFDSNEKVVPMRSLQIYQDDVFGLKSLDKAGKIQECTVPGVEHEKWHDNETVFMKCIEPWLT